MNGTTGRTRTGRVEPTPRRRRHGFEGPGWRAALVAAGLGLAATAPGWAGALAAPVRAAWEAGRDAVPATRARSDLPSSEGSTARSADAWVELIEAGGLEAARWQLRELEAPPVGRGTRPDAAALVRGGLEAAREGRHAIAVDIHTFALVVDPTRPEAYQALADACLAVGDAACAGRAYRALARTLARSRAPAG